MGLSLGPAELVPEPEMPAAPAPVETMVPAPAPAPVAGPPTAAPAPAPAPTAAPEQPVATPQKPEPEPLPPPRVEPAPQPEVAPEPEPDPFADVEEEPIEWHPVADGTPTREHQIRSARTMVAAGGVMGVGSLILLLAGRVESNKPECMFGLDDCADAPRREVTRGLFIGGGLAAAGAVALVTAGLVRMSKLRAGVFADADTETAGITLSGRF